MKFKFLGITERDNDNNFEGVNIYRMYAARAEEFLLDDRHLIAYCYTWEDADELLFELNRSYEKSNKKNGGGLNTSQLKDKKK